MAFKSSFGTIQGAPIEPPRAESPFRICVMADFTGRQNRGLRGTSKEMAARRAVRVTRDNFYEWMTKLGVQLHLPVGGELIAYAFASLDDFHPDQIHDRIATIADAYTAAEKSALVNEVLHHPDFQALESAWRGLDWLLGRAAKGRVEVSLLDVSLAELTADLKASENLASSAIHHLLIEKGVRGPQGQPWGAFVGNYVFSLAGPHMELLGRLAKIVRQANAPFLTTVDPRVLDQAFSFGPDDGPAWQALRQLPEAALLGVCVPRLLLRLPYGENTKSIERFSFEEMSLPPEPSHYLWGNSALGCAVLLAQGFQKAGWACKPGSILELDDLPIHVYSRDGEEEVTLAEAWLARPQNEQLVKRGIMSFQCVRGRAAVQLLRFHSLAQPPQGQPTCDLQGHWSAPGAPPPAPQTSAPLGPKVSMVAQAPAPGRPGSSILPPMEAAPARSVPPAPLLPAVQARPTAAQTPILPEMQSAPAASPTPILPAVQTASAAPAPVDPNAPPAEEEMDPELAALLKSLE